MMRVNYFKAYQISNCLLLKVHFVMRTIIADDGTPPSEIGILREEKKKNRKFTMKSSVDDRKSLEEIFFVYINRKRNRVQAKNS